MARSGTGTSDDRSIQELLADFSEGATTLIRKEVELAKVEMKETASKVAQAGAMFTASAIVAFLALQALSVALGFALASFLPDGVAALVVGVLYLVTAAVLAGVAKGRVSQVGGPQQTVRTIKDDVQVAKESLSRGAATEPNFGRPWASTEG
ncbi:MAG TPA: phage holin family protein [Acidimicrobiales bacterium]|nr:phage holin family protein [Acidimicrobiales bacterium]